MIDASHGIHRYSSTHDYQYQQWRQKMLKGRYTIWAASGQVLTVTCWDFPSPVSVTVTNLRQVLTWVARRRVRQKFFKRCMRCLACLWDGLDCRPVCCIYHKPCGFDESSDLGNKDDDSSSSSASSEGDKSGGEEDDGRARWEPPPPWRCARQKGVRAYTRKLNQPVSI